eukprot:4592876-Amphidinium_carterae.1
MYGRTTSSGSWLLLLLRFAVHTWFSPPNGQLQQPFNSSAHRALPCTYSLRFFVQPGLCMSFGSWKQVANLT